MSWTDSIICARVLNSMKLNKNFILRYTKSHCCSRSKVLFLRKNRTLVHAGKSPITLLFIWEIWYHTLVHPWPVNTISVSIFPKFKYSQNTWYWLSQKALILQSACTNPGCSVWGDTFNSFLYGRSCIWRAHRLHIAEMFQVNSLRTLESNDTPVFF